MRRAATIFTVVALLAAALATSAQADFGFEPGSLDLTFAGAPATPPLQAGSHPAAISLKLGFNTEEKEGVEYPQGQAKDLYMQLPPGLAGTPNPVPTCSAAEFMETESGTPNCPDASAVGVAKLTIGLSGPQLNTYPVYLLKPAPGVAAELGFVVVAHIPVTVDISINPNPPYNLQTRVNNIAQSAFFYHGEVITWGVPASHTHDTERGSCLDSNGEKSCPANVPPLPFITMPTACGGSLKTTFEADSWANPGTWLTGQVETHDDSVPPNPLGVSGCDQLGFAPKISSKTTSVAASSASGLDFDLDIQDEGLTNPEGFAQSEIEKAVVTLPKGVTANPSVAEGLATCSESDFSREAVDSAPGQGCPEASKIGAVEVQTPLLEGTTLHGDVFLATQNENPFHTLLALYIVIREPKLGILVKLAGKVTPDSQTGQLVTTIGGAPYEIPQFPFSHFHFHFQEGARGPLVTPPLCGSYETQAVFTPRSNPSRPLTTTASFQISSGVNGGACPSGGLPPFNPKLTAGTLNNAAGSYSPFDIHISRDDSEQEITHFSIKLPPGVTGKLAGLPFCSDADIAAARARERQPRGGQEELEHPSCPQVSEIGHTLVGAGVGSELTYVPGKVYLAGPYNGSNLSIVAITAAKAGPFDLGTVVIREALKVNPETAEVFVDAGTSDPIPHIIDGIPVHLRDIRIYVDRPEFVLNPTSCEPTSTASTVLGSGTDFASEADDRPVTVTSRFQAADCASLGFKPALKISLKGPTRRAGLPALTAVVRPRAADANIGKAVVTLPPSEFLEQGHIGNSCTRVQFNSGAGNGAGCPANSVLGHAVAVTPLLSEPLEGPVFLRSNGGERKLPDLVAALHSTDINIDLVGFISSLHKKGSDVSQIRTTFAKVPDQPVTSFTLKMFGGKKGLLVNSTNLCKGTHKAISELTGQNGKSYDTEPAVKAQCGKKKHKKTKKGHHKKPGAEGRGQGDARLVVALGHRLTW